MKYVLRVLFLPYVMLLWPVLLLTGAIVFISDLYKLSKGKEETLISEADVIQVLLYPFAYLVTGKTYSDYVRKK